MTSSSSKTNKKESDTKMKKQETTRNSKKGKKTTKRVRTQHPCNICSMLDRQLQLQGRTWEPRKSTRMGMSMLLSPSLPSKVSKRGWCEEILPMTEIEASSLCLLPMPPLWRRRTQFCGTIFCCFLLLGSVSCRPPPANPFSESLILLWAP